MPNNHNRIERADKPHTVYALTDPDNGILRYIGCSRNAENRWKEHCNDGCSYALRAWVEELRIAGKLPRLVILCRCDNYAKAEIREKNWIATASIAFGDALLNTFHRADFISKRRLILTARQQ